MTALVKTAALRSDFSAETFAPFGAVVDRPARIGQRAFYTDWLGAASPRCCPVLHTNRLEPVDLPLTMSRMEKHPHTAQAFVPLDVERYVVAVAPSDSSGRPATGAIAAFLVPGHLGVIYASGVWHAGASVLGREGSFAVLMWRGEPDDEVFAEIEPVLLTEAPPQAWVA